MSPAARAMSLSSLAAVFWGSNFEATHLALDTLPPWSAAAERFAIASAAMLFWLVVAQSGSIATVRRNWVAFLGLGALGIAGFNAALFVGLQTSSAVTAALIMATTPVTTNLLQALWNQQVPDWTVFLGMGFSLLGVAMTIGALGHMSISGSDLLILCGSFAWAAYTVGCRVLVRGATPIETTAWTMLVGAILLVFGAFIFEHPLLDMAVASVPSHLAVLYMAVIGAVLAYLFWQVGIAIRGPGATSIFFNLVPVSALIISAALGDMPSWVQLIGVVLVIAGVLIASGRLTWLCRAAGLVLAGRS